MVKKENKTSNLGLKLTVYVLLLSMVIIFLTTLVSSYFTYQKEIGNIDTTFDQIENSFIKSLESSLWSYNNRDLEIALAGITQLPYVDSLRLKNENQEKSFGDFPSGEVKMRTYSLKFKYEDQVIPLGELQVFAGMDKVYERLYEENISILKQKTVEVLMMAVLIMFIVNQLVTKHLNFISQYLRSLNLGQMDKPLSLTRSRSVFFPNKDTIDHVVDSINNMRGSVKGSYENLQEEMTKRKVAEEKAIDYSLSLELAYKDLYESKTKQMELNKDLSEKYRDLQDAQDKIVEYARAQGMAEVTTGILHDIGNILNNMGMIRYRSQSVLDKSALGTYLKINELLKENGDNIHEYLSTDSKGKKIASSYSTFIDSMKEENTELSEQMSKFQKSIELMSKIIERQQDYAKKQYSAHMPKLEPININKLINYTIELNKISFEKYQINIETQLSEAPEIQSIYHELYNIMANILKNAKEAFQDADGSGLKKVLIRSMTDKDSVTIEIKDNGIGIEEKYLEKIFEKGFTNKEEGHGFGLHTCRQSIRQMGGDLYAHSEGIGKGTSFFIKIPFVVDQGQMAS